MQYTNNFNLKKPEATDFYNVDDFNENMDAVDEKIKDLSDNKQEKISILPPEKGGTGKDNLRDVANDIVNAMPTGTTAPADNDYFVAQKTNGGDTNENYYRKPMTALWNYIKGKIETVLGMTETNYVGKAAKAGTADTATTATSATKATQDGNGNVIANTYSLKPYTLLQGNFSVGGYGNYISVKIPGKYINLISGSVYGDTDIVDSCGLSNYGSSMEFHLLIRVQGVEIGLSGDGSNNSYVPFVLFFALSNSQLRESCCPYSYSDEVEQFTERYSHSIRVKIETMPTYECCAATDAVVRIETLDRNGIRFSKIDVML